MKTNIKILLFSAFILSLLVVALIPQTSASGVSTAFWSRNPLKLAPGETQDVSFGLQNMVGDNDITFTVELENNENNVASLIQENRDYFVPLGSKDDVSVPVRITIPKDAEIGSIYEVSVKFLQSVTGEGGTVQLSTGISSGFPVQIVDDGSSVQYDPHEEERKRKIKFYFSILGLVVLLIVVFGMNRMRKKPEEESNKI